MAEIGGDGKKRALALLLMWIIVASAAALFALGYFTGKGPFKGLGGPKVDEYTAKLEVAEGFYYAREYKKAEPLLRELIEKQPDNATPRLQLGITLTKLGRGNEALAVFEKTAKLDPNNHEAYANMAWVYLDMATNPKKSEVARMTENLDLADEFIDKALDLRPEDRNYTALKKRIEDTRKKISG